MCGLVLDPPCIGPRCIVDPLQCSTASNTEQTCPYARARACAFDHIRGRRGEELARARAFTQGTNPASRWINLRVRVRCDIEIARLLGPQGAGPNVILVRLRQLDNFANSKASDFFLYLGHTRARMPKLKGRF